MSDFPEKNPFGGIRFNPVMNCEGSFRHLKLTENTNLEDLQDPPWFVGGYLENRKGYYTSELYKGERFIHMGIDFWAPPGEPVFAFYDGTVFGIANNNHELDYGPTLVTEHHISDKRLFALFGHLSWESIRNLKTGQNFMAGQKIAETGTKEENGGWIPHLHFQLSWHKPVLPDMPGVVSTADVEVAKTIYPDPRIVLGHIY